MPGMGGQAQNTSSSTTQNQNAQNPNPNPNANMFGGLNLGNMGMGNMGGNPVPSNVDPKVAYKDQNQQLKDMGFINEELNFQVLEKNYGKCRRRCRKIIRDDELKKSI